MFLVDGGSLADPAVAQRARHRLFRNRGDGTFEDVTARSGIRHRGYGMGACAGDYDNDGWVDLYVTSFGPNTLYRNTGTRSFTDVTAVARVGSSSWSTACAFADLDRDGDLDLFVTNYVAVDRSTVRSVVTPARRRASTVTRSISSRWRTSCSVTTGTAPSRTSARRPASARIAGTASVSSLETTTRTDGRRSSSPTTACRIFCFTARTPGAYADLALARGRSRGERRTSAGRYGHRRRRLRR